MICPHCKKPISWAISKETLKRAKELRKQGYSFRDMEKVLISEGHHATYSNLSRYFREAK